MERILAVVDGSEAALRAVDVAAMLAAQIEEKLDIITIVDKAYVADRSLREFARAGASRVDLGGSIGDTSHRDPDVAHERAAVRAGSPILKEWRTGNPAEEVVQYAKNKRVELTNTIAPCGSDDISDVIGARDGTSELFRRRHLVTPRWRCHVSDFLEPR